MYHIVVSSEEIGKQLLQRGCLKRRFTIIPLNKIIARKIANDVVKRAQQIVSEILRVALMHDVVGTGGSREGKAGFVIS